MVKHYLYICMYMYIRFVSLFCKLSIYSNIWKKEPKTIPSWHIYLTLHVYSFCLRNLFFFSLMLLRTYSRFLFSVSFRASRNPLACWRLIFFGIISRNHRHPGEIFHPILHYRLLCFAIKPDVMEFLHYFSWFQ